MVLGHVSSCEFLISIYTKVLLSKSESVMKVLFICRGSVYDGIGHVMRSRTVACAMSPSIQVKLVAIGDPYVDNLLNGKDLDYAVITRDEQAMRIFREFMPDIVMLDLMYLNEADFQSISESTMTVSLSPIFNCLPEVDLVFHRTAFLGENWVVNGKGPLIRSGLKYTIVSEHCRRIPDDVYQKNLSLETLSILVSMGGTDAANKTLRVLNVIKQVSERLLIWVLLGEGYVHSYQGLVECIHGSQHEIILAKTNDSMWRILDTCSLAILAGGVTTYEAAYAGLPSINTLETKQHFFLIRELVERGACVCAGYTFDESLSVLNDIIRCFNRDRHALLKMRLKSKELIDGLGVQRIVDEIQIYYQKYHLRR